MPRKKQPDNVNPFAALSEALVKQSREPNLHGYRPHAKQVKFHSSSKKGRLYIGGNRSGKTTGGVTEDLWWVKGQHPYRATPDRPVKGRVVGVDFVNGIAKILLPQFARWTPPSLLVNGSWEDSYDKQERTLRFANESFIEFMSYDQDTDKFAGTSRDFMHYDEEPPKHVYNECQARLVDTNGDWWLTMTPVEGMTWIHDDIYEKSMDGRNPLIDIIQVDMGENPYLSAEARENFLGTLSEDERNAREHGSFVQLSGLVYPGFDAGGIHTYPTSFDPKTAPPGTEYYRSMDHGWRNPTAWLWHAVLPDGSVVTFDEHYASELTIAQHSEIVLRKTEAYGLGDIPSIGDPAISQTSGITGTSVHTEYALRNLPIAFGNNSVEIGVPKVQSYLRLKPKTDHGWWRVTENCINLRRELRQLRWAAYSSRKMQYENNPQEKIHKKNDHASDAARYFFTFMPDLTPEVPTTSTVKLPTSAAISETFDQMLVRMNLDPEVRWTVESGTDMYEYEKG